MLSSLGFYIGYHALINWDGSLLVTRQDFEESAAVIGYNQNALHICLAGNFDNELPTTEQITSLRAWLEQKMKLYNIPLANIYPHRWAAPYKSCYGKLLAEDWARNLVTVIPLTVVERKKALLEQLVGLYKLLLAKLQNKKLGSTMETGKEWYMSKTLWIAVLQGVLGVVVVLATQHPTWGWALVAKSVIDGILRILTSAPLGIAVKLGLVKKA